MKKILLGLSTIFVLLIVGIITWYIPNYVGHHYYVQIQGDGKISDIEDGGRVFTRYNYSLEGYDREGKTENIKLSESHNLRHKAYLDVSYSQKKGVVSWKECKKIEVPKEALEHFD
jgi:uncharacterized protein (TIGR01655 family)